jgi:hypothetical protein
LKTLMQVKISYNPTNAKTTFSETAATKRKRHGCCHLRKLPTHRMVDSTPLCTSILPIWCMVRVRLVRLVRSLVGQFVSLPKWNPSSRDLGSVTSPSLAPAGLETLLPCGSIRPKNEHFWLCCFYPCHLVYHHYHEPFQLISQVTDGRGKEWYGNHETTFGRCAFVYIYLCIYFLFVGL